MRKKIIKKAVVKKKATISDDVEMPMARIDEDNDVAEDYKVINMVDIAAPVIEFELPNLGERKMEPTKNSVAEKKPAAKKKKKEVKSGEKKETLTAQKLNNELVRLRAPIVKAKNRLMAKLVRQKKTLEEKKGARENAKKEQERKAARLGEEILGLKTFDRDTVAKFAVLNTKSMSELKIDGKTAVAERLMYKLARQDVLVKEVEAIRAKYTEWNKTAAFFMQRLGLQYANKEKKEKKTEQKQKEEEENEEDDSDGAEGETAEDEEVAEESGNVEDYDESDVEMVDSDEEAGEEAAQKRRQLLLSLIGVKEDKSRPALKPKKRKIVEEDEDVGKAVQKKTKMKESVKLEMKKILEKELKTKEVRNPKQGNAKNLKKKAAPAKKNGEKKEEENVEVLAEENPDQKTLVMKVDLSKGGTIGSAKSKALIPKVSQLEAQKEEEMDDDESSAFFLPKGGAVPKKKIVKAVKKTTVPAKDSVEVQAPQAKLKAEPVRAVVPEKKKGSSKNNTLAGEMHPSWAASQLKKKEMQAAKPCGKKITFGDDD
ncbi:unnamed protein product [Caenorhabditis sp. 36 PRJEB53466]|nr:unnamed protein product [Caenorhabditis sp. 36 PRJEB53466]